MMEMELLYKVKLPAESQFPQYTKVTKRPKSNYGNRYDYDFGEHFEVKVCSDSTLQVISSVHTTGDRPICAVSVKNIIAFTSNKDLLQQGQTIFDSPKGVKVYVADLNTPWECYLVYNGLTEITNLSWDHAGLKLLVGTHKGVVHIYGMVANLLNNWGELNLGTFNGGRIIASAWMNAPRRVCLVPNKLSKTLYSEKYDVSLLTNNNAFGGRLPEGVIVVTEAGYIGAIIFLKGSTQVKTCIRELPGLHNEQRRITTRTNCMDIGYCKGGKLMIVSCSDGESELAVRLSEINISFDACQEKVQLWIESKPKLVLIEKVSGLKITAVKFVDKMNCESFLIASTNKGTHCSTLCLFTFTNHKWEIICEISLDSSIEELCALSAPITLRNFDQAPLSIFQPLVSVSLANGCIQLVRSDTLEQVGFARISGSNFKEGSGRSRFVSMRFSWSSCLLAALDEQSQLHVYKVHPNIDACNAVLMLELSLMGGLDPWDIMICLRRDSIEEIIERLTETFVRQPQKVQSKFYVGLEVIKGALFRLANLGVRANELQLLVLLHLISGVLKAFIRPSDSDKDPSEHLRILLGCSVEGKLHSDVDEVIECISIPRYNYVVEPFLLHQFARYLAWCENLALYLLSTLPEIRYQKVYKPPGWEIARDSKAITELRELMVLMRLWGSTSPSSLPKFWGRVEDPIDILPHVFRLLTQLSVNVCSPDNLLISLSNSYRMKRNLELYYADRITNFQFPVTLSLSMTIFLIFECCALRTEIDIPNFTEFKPVIDGVSLQALLSRTSGLQFTFGLKPWVNKMGGQHDEQTEDEFWVDGLRFVWLQNSNCVKVKRCNRCGFTFRNQAPSTRLLDRIWENLWVRNCPCGGFWKVRNLFNKRTNSN